MSDFLSTMRGENAWIQVQDKLEIHNREFLWNMCDTFVQEGVRNLVLDLNRCYMDSAALGVLIRINRRIRDKGGTLILKDMSDGLQEGFKKVGLDALFTLSSRDPFGQKCKLILPAFQEIDRELLGYLCA